MSDGQSCPQCRMSFRRCECGREQLLEKEMEQEQQENCRSCRFSFVFGERYCRRYPPTVTFNDIGTVTVHGPKFPRVNNEQWCGEWQAKQEQ